MADSTATGSTQFGWQDHCAFGLMVAVSTVVGGLIGVCGKQDTKVDYLLGGRSMKVLPIAVSLVFSQISGIALIGVPTEIYLHGTQYYVLIISIVIASAIQNYVFLPVFFDLKLTSTYEYLELRFNRQIRCLISFLFDVMILLYIPIVIYVPALMFNQVSGVNLHLVSILVSATCIFYTMLGGLKAVVWTDFLQSFVTVGSTVVIVVIGVVQVGGIDVVFHRSNGGQRLELFNFDPSPLSRMSFWNVTVGMTFFWLSSMATGQGLVQKMISLPDLRSARKSVVLFCVGNIFMKSLTVIVGLAVYAAYYDCDPRLAQKIDKADQVIPYFVMDMAGHIHGLPGLFIAGIFSAALSAMSSHLNCLSATVYEDLVLPFISKKKNIERQAHIILKLIVVVFGVVCVLLVYVVEHMGAAIFDLNMSLTGITNGTFLGVFILGMVFPWANTKGAIAGIVSTVVLMSWVVFGTTKVIAEGLLSYPNLPLTTEGCSDYNTTLATTSSVSLESRSSRNEDVFVLYRVSFLLYGMIGTIIVVTVGLIVSWMTGFSDPSEVDPRLIVPYMKRFTGPPACPQEKEKLNVNLPPEVTTIKS